MRSEPRLCTDLCALLNACAFLCSSSASRSSSRTRCARCSSSSSSRTARVMTRLRADRGCRAFASEAGVWLPLVRPCVPEGTAPRCIISLYGVVQRWPLACGGRCAMASCQSGPVTTSTSHCTADRAYDKQRMSKPTQNILRGTIKHCGAYAIW